MNNEVGIGLFRVLVPAIFLTIQFLLCRKTVRLFRATKIRNWAIPVTIGAFILFNLASMYGFVFRPTASGIPQWFQSWGVYPFFIWHGSTFLLGLVLFLSFLVKLPFRSVWWAARKTHPKAISRIEGNPTFQSFNSSRRTFLRRGMYGMTAVSVGGIAYGMAFENSNHEVRTTEVEIPGLDPRLDGFVIGMISDIHSGIFMSRETMERYAGLTNSLGADLIVVTGDFVNGRVEEVQPFGEAFSHLSAPHGIYGVLGNHDFYTGHVRTVAKNVEECGIRLLRDAETIIEAKGARFSLAGIDDVGSMTSARTRMERAYGRNLATLPRILMSHRPYYLKAAKEFAVDLMLSGHTHGGQVVLGRFGETTIAPASLASGFVWGLYQSGKTRLYVNRGIGTVGIPLRINCPPELTRIVLRSQDVPN